MIDHRLPLHYVGTGVAVLGAAMALPAAVDLWEGDPNWRAFALAGFLSGLAGAGAALATRQAAARPLDRRQLFLLSSLIWPALAVFAALPFQLGAPAARPVDAFFEAMSGLTTTGSTVFSGLQEMPAGTLLWRGMLQWIGGLGIVIVAMVFLPALRVGGNQIFQAEGFEGVGDTIPRAKAVASAAALTFLALTLSCVVAYSAAGMSLFDAAVHAMTTVATGGFSNHDGSLGHYGEGAQYVALGFMLVSGLSFPLLMGAAERGGLRSLTRDSQTRAYLVVALGLCLAVLGTRAAAGALAGPESMLREVAFNAVSVLTGTGYANADYGGWGAAAVTLMFLGGLIGGCSQSTSCSIKIWRHQILLAGIGAQMRRIQSPNAATPIRWNGRAVSEDTLSSVMAFVFLFMLTLAVVAIALALMGYDAVTAVSGAATALANVGPGLGPIIGPSGNFAPLSDEAKWLLSAAMLLGRLELLTAFVLFTTAFWRA